MSRSYIVMGRFFGGPWLPMHGEGHLWLLPRGCRTPATLFPSWQIARNAILKAKRSRSGELEFWIVPVTAEKGVE